VTRRGARGYLKCRVECDESDAGFVIATLVKHHARVTEGARYDNGGVTWLVDLTTVPEGEGGILKLVTERDAQRAVSEHRVLP
jgi:hypothetical protein